MTTTARPERLRRLARRPVAPPQPEQEVCELCGELLEPQHRHLLDLEARRLMCACRACSLLLDRGAAGGGHYRLVPERRLLLDDFELDDRLWAGLRIPVDMAFFFHSTATGHVAAVYPSPAGATESLLELDTWQAIEAANPVLRELEPDVEALLVNRSRGARDHYVVPIDDCYELVGTLRTHWRGLSGGEEVWAELGGFFKRLNERGRQHVTQSR